MPNELDPIVGQWYWHHDKGQRFYVTAVDKDPRTVEVQHFDSDIEEFTFDEWRDLDIELSEEPENWTGAMDVTEQDDLGTEITDTTKEDWGQPQQEFHLRNEEKLEDESEVSSDDYGEGYMEEEALSSSDTGTEPAAAGPENPNLTKRPDGVFEESFSDIWYAEYSEDRQTGLWRVDVFKHDVAEWHNIDLESLEDAMEAARNFYNQA